MDELMNKNNSFDSSILPETPDLNAIEMIKYRYFLQNRLKLKACFLPYHTGFCWSEKNQQHY